MRSFLLLLKYAKRKFEIDLILWEKNVVLAFFHVVAINQIFPPFATAKIQLFCFTASKMPIYFFNPAFCPTETTFHFAKTAFCNSLITRKPSSKGNTFCCSAQTLFNYTNTIIRFVVSETILWQNHSSMPCPERQNSNFRQGFLPSKSFPCSLCPSGSWVQD